MLARALAGLPLLCGACTILLDPDNLPPQTDARAIDAPAIDADPSALRLDDPAPLPLLLEGTGADGGRPVLVVLDGANLVDSATVSVDLEGAEDVSDVAHAQAGGSLLGVAFRLPVIPGFDSGTRKLTITVTQGDASDSVELAVTGLPELMMPPAPAALAELYSQVTVTAPVHLTGDRPVVLAATAGMRIGAKVDVNAATVTAGPGGCAGGEANSPGGCGEGGGRSGVLGGGGGGGGFGMAGDMGANGLGTGGNGGAETGRPSLVPVVSEGNEGNRGNGGGGSGGKGGGAGGVLYLAAGGTIDLTDGALESDGGTPPALGNGGGGSGGAILVRTGGALVAAAGSLRARGADGGGNGGAGGDGRVRVDAPAPASLAGLATPGAFRGPAWASGISPFVDEPADSYSLVLTGQMGRELPLRLNDTALALTATPGASSTATVTGLPLVLGHNELCAVAEPGLLVAESLACIDLFYPGR